ncbi:MAG: methyltransferase [Desulfobacula sp.]|nr:methyltransferase [Desulfobacula sp.]
MAKFSPDPFLGHEIKVSQPENGYRFSMDPFILAGHVQPIGVEKIVDIGCGCAIIPLILAFRYPDTSIIGVEIQKELSWFARQNIIANNLENTIRIIHKDIKNIQVSDINGKADIIISNPPYIKKNPAD